MWPLLQRLFIALVIILLMSGRNFQSTNTVEEVSLTQIIIIIYLFHSAFAPKFVIFFDLTANFVLIF